MPQENTPRKIMFSGIQPSGELHIGNYLGAIQNWVKYMDTYDCIYSIVDYHALTVPYDTQLMPTRIQELAMMLLACGLTPERCTLFRQSDVLEHTALSWILSCHHRKLFRTHDSVQRKIRAARLSQYWFVFLPHFAVGRYFAL